MKVMKKNGTHEDYNESKIIVAIRKSAKRIGYELTEDQESSICNIVYNMILGKDPFNVASIPVNNIHNYVEKALDVVAPEVAKSYKDYRNYKKEFVYSTIHDIEKQIHSMLTEVDRSNSNSNTRYISTKRTEVAKIFAKEMYQKMFLPVSVIQAIKDGYIYIHDLSDMLLPQYNCCLVDMQAILNGGFKLEGIKYTEPKDIRTAVGQMGDIVQIISAQHFGGHTVPEIDKVLSWYYKMTIDMEVDYAYDIMSGSDDFNYSVKQWVIREARKKAYKELKQSLQGFEIKMNTVVSARGSYPSNK